MTTSPEIVRKDIGASVPNDGQDRERRPGWKVAPFDKPGIAAIVATYVAMTGVLTLIGLAIVEWGDASRFGDADADVNRWLERRRTDRWTELADFGSRLSDTLTKVLLGVALLPVCLWLFRRWHDWTLMFAGLVLEVSVFGTTAMIVGRDRPPVEQLDGAPTDSFPSGHVAASIVFYVGLAMVIFWQTRNAAARTIAVVIAVTAPSVVAVSRLYQGMHYPSDALAGALLAFVSLAVVRWALMRTIHRAAPDAVHRPTAARG
jgi:undecaprenyl-diphosphatase